MNANVLLLASLGLFAVGLYGLLTCQHLIRVLIALQLMAKAATLALLLAGRLSNQIQLGQSLATTVIVADTVVVIVGLALVVRVQRHFGTLNIAELIRPGG